MAPKIYTQPEIAKKLHRATRWLSDWLRQNPAGPGGEPLFIQVGRTRRFTGDQALLIIDMILTQEEAKQTNKDNDGCIYFVEGGGLIKIGYSRSMVNRMKKMGTDMPGASLLLTVPGSFKIEKLLHRHFAHLREHGEWFRKAPDLVEYIEQRKQIEA